MGRLGLSLWRPLKKERMKIEVRKMMGLGWFSERTKWLTVKYGVGELGLSWWWVWGI